MGWTIHDLDAIRYRDAVKNTYAKNKGIILLRITDIQKPEIDVILRKELYG